eukprot:m.473000 g.473000  ORF g.473000 m.473000 type:complete len:141 (+) comp33613_c0_seq1:228-650(+)
MCSNLLQFVEFHVASARNGRKRIQGSRASFPPRSSANGRVLIYAIWLRRFDCSLLTTCVLNPGIGVSPKCNFGKGEGCTRESTGYHTKMITSGLDSPGYHQAAVSARLPSWSFIPWSQTLALFTSPRANRGRSKFAGAVE